MEITSSLVGKMVIWPIGFQNENQPVFIAKNLVQSNFLSCSVIHHWPVFMWFLIILCNENYTGDQCGVRELGKVYILLEIVHGKTGKNNIKYIYQQQKHRQYDETG